MSALLRRWRNRNSGRIMINFREPFLLKDCCWFNTACLWSILVEGKEVVQRATYSAPLPVTDKQRIRFERLDWTWLTIIVSPPILNAADLKYAYFVTQVLIVFHVIEEWYLSWGMTPESFSAFKSTPLRFVGLTSHLGKTAILAHLPPLILIASALLKCAPIGCYIVIRKLRTSRLQTLSLYLWLLRSINILNPLRTND